MTQQPDDGHGQCPDTCKTCHPEGRYIENALSWSRGDPQPDVPPAQPWSKDDR